jgi:hypothetical protein
MANCYEKFLADDKNVPILVCRRHVSLVDLKTIPKVIKYFIHPTRK